MRVLGHDDTVRCLPMAGCIEAMAAALAGLARGDAHNPLRLRATSERAHNRLVMMPALRFAEPRLWGLKAIVVTPENPARRGIDSHQGVVLVHDGDSGRLLGLVDARAITAIRTAAVSAVATRALARPDARRVTILGCGVQGIAHIAAMRAVVADADVVVCSRDAAKAERVAAAHGVRADADLAAAVRRAEIVCTVTSAKEPILDAAWLADGVHVNAVGSSIPTVRELDPKAVRACTLFVDRRESALNEAGEIVQAIAAGELDASHVRAELGEVLAGTAAGRSSATEKTLFKSLGLAVEDLAAAELALANAAREGVGVEVDL